MIIEEFLLLNSTCYIVKEISLENKVLSSRKVIYPLFKRENKGFTLYVLYSDSMTVLSEVYEYINNFLVKSPETSRKQVIHSLRIYFMFCSIYNFDPYNLTIDGINQFKAFLLGVVHHCGPITERSPTTINCILNAIRQFYKYLGIDGALTREKELASTITLNSDQKITINIKKCPYTYGGSTQHEIPKFISPSEFLRLIEYSNLKNDLTATLLMTLMYQYGLRLGEALGLTLEDIDTATVEHEVCGVLYIRNRLSDKKFKFSKNLYHPKNAEEYKQEFYKNSVNKINISIESYTQINSYIENMHSNAQKNYPHRYSNTLADKVSRRADINENHYIFLNNCGGTLSDQAWNKRLKVYFKECDIDVDTEKRKLNLSHRFRHGFAMYHAQFKDSPVSALSLQHLLRHKSINSTSVYYNPTEKMKIKENENFLSNLQFLKENEDE